MPAVTVSDLSALPRIGALDATVRQRPVAEVTTAPKEFDSNGVPVQRAFADVELHLLDPFIHLDHIGGIDFEPNEPKGSPWHPHRGFETATYMMDGVLEHADSTGGGGIIAPGATQWMTAGSGILHIETPAQDAVAAGGGWFHGVQLWVNLPRARKWTPPRYQDLAGDRVTLLTTPDAGALVRLIAGSLDGHPGPGTTYSPVTMLHLSLEPGAQVVMPWPTDHNALVYILGGDAFIGGERLATTTGQLVVLGDGDAFTVTAAPRQHTRTGTLEVLVLGGQPIGEPVAWYGPFVMNTRAELQQAYDDFDAGRLGTIPVGHPLAPTG
ncbi:MAG: pirin family protein [Ilumatobacteraceae bacterium]